jgi:hypothetical protein
MNSSAQTETPPTTVPDALRGPWMAVLSSNCGDLHDSVDELDEGDNIEIAVVRESAAPVDGRCPGSYSPADVLYELNDTDFDDIVETYVRWATREELVELYRLTLTDPTPGMLAAYPSRRGHFARVTVAEIRAELAGKDLACWCPLMDAAGRPVPCHGDILLAIANAAKED